jgi:hypothetical protein
VPSDVPQWEAIDGDRSVNVSDRPGGWERAAEDERAQTRGRRRGSVSSRWISGMCAVSYPTMTTGLMFDASKRGPSPLSLFEDGRRPEAAERCHRLDETAVL